MHQCYKTDEFYNYVYIVRRDAPSKKKRLVHLSCMRSLFVTFVVVKLIFKTITWILTCSVTFPAYSIIGIQYTAVPGPVLDVDVYVYYPIRSDQRDISALVVWNMPDGTVPVTNFTVKVFNSNGMNVVSYNCNNNQLMVVLIRYSCLYNICRYRIG